MTRGVRWQHRTTWCVNKKALSEERVRWLFWKASLPLEKARQKDARARECTWPSFVLLAVCKSVKAGAAEYGVARIGGGGRRGRGRARLRRILRLFSRLSHKVTPMPRDCGNSGHVRAYTRRARGPHTRGKSRGVWKEKSNRGEKRKGEDRTYAVRGTSAAIRQGIHGNIEHVHRFARVLHELGVARHPPFLFFLLSSFFFYFFLLTFSFLIWDSVTWCIQGFLNHVAA